jgi:branched-chain amino acid transport system permease protein
MLLETHGLTANYGQFRALFGVDIAVATGGLLEIFSADSSRIPAGALERASLDLGLVTVGVMPLMTFVSAILAILALNGLFYHTALGRAFRATSDDSVTAGLMGIELKRVFAMATGIAMVVVTLAALYLGMRANFDPSIGPARLIYAFRRSSSADSEACGARSWAGSSSALRKRLAPR